MSASSAPSAKAALLTLLQADADLDGVQIKYAFDGPTRAQESIWFERVILDEEAAALGKQRRDERYRIEVFVHVARDGNNAQACEERSWALAARVEEVVRANPTLSNSVSGWAVCAGAEQTPGVADGQRISIVVMQVSVYHRK